MTNLWVHITIGQYPICHNDATSHNTDVIDRYSQQVQPPQIQAAPKAQWDTEEVFALLGYLAANKSQDNGTGNFKETTFIDAVTTISPLLSTGPPKTAKHCKTKWALVSLFVFFLLLKWHLSYLQLKVIYKTIEAYTHVSGAPWDNVNGANIQGATAATVFKAYITQKVWFLFYFIRCYLCDNTYVV